MFRTNYFPSSSLVIWQIFGWGRSSTHGTQSPRDARCPMVLRKSILVQGSQRVVTKHLGKFLLCCILSIVMEMGRRKQTFAAEEGKWSCSSVQTARQLSRERYFFFHLRCGNYGAKAVRQLKVFWGSQIGSWALQPLPTGNVRLGVKLLIRLRTQ